MNTARSIRIAAFGAFTLALALPALAQDSEDTILLKDGRRPTGKVQSEEYGGVSVSVQKGAAYMLAWKQIQSIQYGAPPDFTKAMEALTQGNLEDARGLLDTLKQDQKLRPVLRQQVLFHLSVANQRLGKFDDAIAGYNEILKAFPKSRYLRSIGDNLVNCYLSKPVKDADGAGKALEQFMTGAKSAGVEEAFLTELRLLQARVLEEQKKTSDAKQSYLTIQNGSNVPPAVVQEARLGTARCLVLEGNTAGAEEQFRKLTAEEAPNNVLAGAWNGIGDILMEVGKKKRDSGVVLDALYSFLRGVVQFPPSSGESTMDYEHSLWGAATCFKYVSDLEPNTNLEKKKLYNERSKDRWDQLKKEFPNSLYLAKR